MVRIDDIPIDEGRIPLDQLADFMDANGHRLVLITISQEMVEENKEAKKTGGLKANLWTGRNFKSKWDINKKTASIKTYPDGLMVTQKWGKIPSNDIVKKLKELGYDDTDILSQKFFEYKLVNQRSGFARLIPVAVSDKAFEKLE